MSALPALTVWQPWATLIIAGAKPYEFRSWQAPKALRGRRIAIHAGARPLRKAEVQDLILRLRGGDPWSTCLHAEIALPILDRLLDTMRDMPPGAFPAMAPLGHVLGTAMLGIPRNGHDIAAEFGGPVNDSDRAGHANWGWPLTDIVRLEPPAPARGAQGFWTWTDARAA